MDSYVGKKTVYIVTKVTEQGVYLDMGSQDGKMQHIGWPPQGLLLVDEKAYQLSKEQLVFERIKKLWNQSRWVKNNPTQAY
jgi:hypothetical protein